VIPSNAVWSRRTVLATGCSGFVGQWLLQRLIDSGARVIGFCRSEMRSADMFSGIPLPVPFTLVRGDLSDYSLLERTMREHDVDTVFHLAAQAKADNAQRQPRETFETNIQGTWNLLEAVRNAGRPIRVVLASTPLEGMSPYAASKVCCEVIARCYHQTYRVMLAIARTTNLYGGGDLSFERIIPGTIRAVLCGESPLINSDGLAERDYLYVEDAVTGYLLLAEAMEHSDLGGETFTFGTESPVTVLKTVETILKLMGRLDLRPRVLGLSGNASFRHSSSEATRKRLGWAPAATLESGLKKTIEWYQGHASELNLEIRNG